MSSDSSGAQSDIEKRLTHVEGDIWLVPCIANYHTNTFQPLLQPVSDDESFIEASKRKGWTELEDKTLLQIVQNRGPNSWGLIARELNSLLYNGRKAKIGRQCRERWNNHVDPSIIKGNWSLEEDIYILEMQIQFNNKWSEIARGLEGRTENSVKNRFKSMIKKAAKDWPNGFDVVNILLAEKKKQIIEINNGDFISLSSPIIRSANGPGFSDPPKAQVLGYQPAHQQLPQYQPSSDKVNITRARILQMEDFSNMMEEDMYTYYSEIESANYSRMDEELPDQNPSPSMYLQFS